MQVRAKTTDGREVVGYHCYSKRQDQHFVIQCDDGPSPGPNISYFPGQAENSWFRVIKIDPATAAVDTGKDAKNGRIFGSYPELGFQGGDHVHFVGGRYYVWWNNNVLAWYVGAFDLGCRTSDELEIIHDKAVKKPE